MPANVKMRDLILAHADLIIEAELPPPRTAFCAHVSAYEVLHSGTHPCSPAGSPLIGHPGDSYVDYVARPWASRPSKPACSA